MSLSANTWTVQVQIFSDHGVYCEDIASSIMGTVPHHHRIIGITREQTIGTKEIKICYPSLRGMLSKVIYINQLRITRSYEAKFEAHCLFSETKNSVTLTLVELKWTRYVNQNKTKFTKLKRRQQTDISKMD